MHLYHYLNIKVYILLFRILSIFSYLISQNNFQLPEQNESELVALSGGLYLQTGGVAGIVTVVAY